MRPLIMSFFVLLNFFAFSQQTISNNIQPIPSSIEFNGGKYEGYLMELNASSDIVEDVIKQRFKLQGIKPKETKGFMVFRNATIPLIDGAKAMDAFFKIERKSRKEKDQTVVYFIAAPMGEIPEDKIKPEASKVIIVSGEKNSAFLVSLIPDVNQGVYNKEVSDQQSQLKKEEKKMANLVEDQSDMEKKFKKLQSEIEFNKKAQEKQIAEIEKAKNILNELVAKDPSKTSQ